MKLWPFGRKSATSETRSNTRNPEQWFLDWVRGDDTASGESVTVESAKKIAAVWACVRNISEDEAKIPLVTYKRLKRGKERAIDHPIYTLLKDSPNKDQSAFDFRSTMTQYALLRGNAYAEIVKDGGGNILYLSEPLDSSRVTPKRALDGTLYYEVMNNGVPVRMAQDRIFHLKGMGDGISGYSVIGYAKQSLASALAADKFGASFIRNGLNPGGVLEHPASLSPAAMKNLRESLKDVHGGADKAGNLLILEEGMKYQAQTMNPEDAQFLETRQFLVVDVCRWFRMPPHKVAELSRATFSNIEQQSIDYVNDTLTPWFVRWEQEISRKLLRPSERRDYFAEHLVNGLLRGDAAARGAFYGSQFNIGSLSINDVREMENMNPVDGGDTYFVPLNMVPLDRALNPPELPEKPAIPEKTPPVDDAKRFAAHEKLLAAALQRTLNLEADRARAAAKKGQLVEWREKFYAEHAQHVRNAIEDVCEAIATIFDPLFVKTATFSIGLGCICVSHCKRSASEAVDEKSVEAWATGSRSREQAATIVQQIASMVKSHGN